MIGASDFVIFARLKVTPGSFADDVPSPSAPTAAGVLVSWDGPTDWSVVLADEDGLWSFDVAGGDAWWNWQAETPPGPGSLRVQTAPVASGTEILWGEMSIVLEHDIAYAAGLALSGGEVLFEGVDPMP